MPAPEQLFTCGKCGGEGAIETPQPFSDDPHYCRVDKCDACDGAGFYVGEAVPEPYPYQPGDPRFDGADAYEAYMNELQRATR